MDLRHGAMHHHVVQRCPEQGNTIFIIDGANQSFDRAIAQYPLDSGRDPLRELKFEE